MVGVTGSIPVPPTIFLPEIHSLDARQVTLYSGHLQVWPSPDLRASRRFGDFHSLGVTRGKADRT
jgi:hypothetical protein